MTALLSAGFLFIFFLPKPPAGEMIFAVESLSVAKRNQADRYTPEFYNQASVSCDSGMAIWRRENRKFILFRKFDLVREYALLSAGMSDSANIRTALLKAEMKEGQARIIDTLNKIVKEINDHYSSFPYSFEIRERITRGKMLLIDAETAFTEGNYIDADSYITDSENLLVSSREFADLNLREYFQSFPQWEKWIALTLSESEKTGGYAIIVDKFARKLILYHGGKKIREYSAELGRNWIGSKRIMGDMATPEGMYQIIKKLEGSGTKYHRALLLNYPNSEDMARFKRDIRNGALPPTADIGGMIEIHGGGGRGADWTEGCIALANNDIDALFPYVRVGTRVTIVGSLYDQKKIFEN